MKKDVNIKKRIFQIIQIGQKSDFASWAFDLFIVIVIVTNLFITFFQTFEQSVKYKDILAPIEFVTILIFLAEYILRIWTAEYLYPKENPFRAKLQFVLSFYGIVDLLTILPFFLPFLLPSGAVAFRMFRVVRIFHLFRLNSGYDAFNVITDVLKEKRQQLVSSVFLIGILMLASSMCMYSIEHEAQPENFPNAFSGIWWSVSTLLTVGYGDIYPVTVFGKMMAIVIAFLGVGMVAIPTGIISAGFMDYYSKAKEGKTSIREEDIVTLAITGKHPFAGKKIGELMIPEGLYVAALMREDKIYPPQAAFVVHKDDCLVLGASQGRKIPFQLQELAITPEHPWAGVLLEDLSEFRQGHIVMIKCDGKNVQPKESMRVKAGDMMVLFEYKREG